MGQVCSQDKNSDSNMKAEGKRSRTVTTAADKTKLVQIDQKEIVLAKLMVQRDRLTAKINAQEDKMTQLKKKALQQAKEGNKDSAMYTVKKVKRLKDFKKGLMNKLDFMDRQVDNIENAMDDVAFTKVLKESNNALSKLNEEIDMEEIRIAKELQEEGKMRQEELDDLLADSDDEDLKEELAKIEGAMYQEEFNKVDLGPEKTQQPVQETNDDVMQEEKAQPQAMLA